MQWHSGRIEQPDCSKSVSPLNNTVISKTIEFCLQGEKFRLVNTASNTCHQHRTCSLESSDLQCLERFLCTELLRKVNGYIQLPKPVTWGDEGYANYYMK